MYFPNFPKMHLEFVKVKEILETRFENLEQCQNLLDFYVEPIQVCVVGISSTICGK
jgi:hypothetical protein